MNFHKPVSRDLKRRDLTGLSLLTIDGQFSLILMMPSALKTEGIIFYWESILPMWDIL